MTETNDTEADSEYTGSMGDNGLRFGWCFSADSERVWNPKNKSNGPLIITRNGELESRFIQSPKDSIGKARSTLWQRLGPIEIEGLEIRQQTKLWHEERDEWLQAVEINVSEDPEPIIRFKIVDSYPVEYIEYLGSHLEELRNDGHLKTQQEVNDKFESMLDHMNPE